MLCHVDVFLMLRQTRNIRLFIHGVNIPTHRPLLTNTSLLLSDLSSEVGRIFVTHVWRKHRLYTLKWRWLDQCCSQIPVVVSAVLQLIHFLPALNSTACRVVCYGPSLVCEPSLNSRDLVLLLHQATRHCGRIATPPFTLIYRLVVACSVILMSYAVSPIHCTIVATVRLGLLCGS